MQKLIFWIVYHHRPSGDKKGRKKFAHITLLLYNNYENNYITKENTNMSEENKNTKQKSVKETFDTKPKHTPQPDKQDKKDGE